MESIEDYLKSHEDLFIVTSDGRKNARVKSSNSIFISTGSAITDEFSKAEFEKWVKNVNPKKYWYVIEEAATNKHLHAIIISDKCFEYDNAKHSNSWHNMLRKPKWILKNNINFKVISNAVHLRKNARERNFKMTMRYIAKEGEVQSNCERWNANYSIMLKEQCLEETKDKKQDKTLVTLRNIISENNINSMKDLYLFLLDKLNRNFFVK